MRRTQEKFLEAMQKGLPRARLEPEKAGNGLDQKLRKDDRVHQEEREQSCDRELRRRPRN